MLKHLAGVEDHWFTYCLGGHEVIEPWKSADWKSDEDWDWNSAADETHADLDGLLVVAIARSEEYARHAGHGDLIRESIDGAKDV